MPTRMIRGDDLLESPRYMALSAEDKVFYLHCLFGADDFGLLVLTPLTIGRRFFVKRPSDAYLRKRISTLEAAGLMRTYEYEGVCFGFLPRFRQRLKNFRCKNP